MDKQEHVHQYQRVVMGTGRVYFKCMVKTGCSHYIREEFAEGRQSLCPRCGGVFVLNKANMSAKKPHCRGCVKKYNKVKKEELEHGQIERTV